MKTKVFIITGFLGSGKTTLLKRILAFSNDLSKTIVLVNEFGKVGIDGSLIKKTATTNIVELNSGCICCTLKIDMIQTLQTLSHQYSPERLVIEATGVADPLSISDALNDRMLRPNFQLEKIITVVDSDFWEAREVFGTVFHNQINEADLILLNKIDTLDKADVAVILKQIQDESAKALVFPCLYCNIDPDIIWSCLEPDDTGFAKDSPFKAYNPQTDLYSSLNTEGTMTAKEAGFMSFIFETKSVLDKELFTIFLKDLPLELFRIKGPVRFLDGTQMLNFVGGKTQWQEWSDTENTCLAFVGWDVIEERVLEKLNQCILRT
ncbi:CobW family GTP-binding protein [Desulfobacula sp.]